MSWLLIVALLSGGAGEVPEALRGRLGAASGSPVAVWRGLQAEVEPRAYLGAALGPAGVLTQGVGNDADLAATFAGLLQSMGYEARVISGEAWLAPHDLRLLLGTEDPRAALNLLGDRPARLWREGERVLGVITARTVTEARLPLAETLGAGGGSDTAERIWIRLDPAYRAPQPRDEVFLAELAVAPRSTLDLLRQEVEVIEGGYGPIPRNTLSARIACQSDRARVASEARERSPLEAVIALDPERPVTELPRGLPYRFEPGEAPEAPRLSITVAGLAADWPVADLDRAVLTLSYLPDAASSPALEEARGAEWLALAQLRATPVLRLDGVEIARGGPHPAERPGRSGGAQRRG